MAASGRHARLATCLLAAALAGCGSTSTSGNPHEDSAAGLRATIRGAEAELHAGHYEAFCENYLATRLQALIVSVSHGKTCPQLVAEQTAQAHGANIVGVLKPNSHIAVAGNSATVYAPHERTLFVYSEGQWKAEWSEEVS